MSTKPDRAAEAAAREVAKACRMGEFDTGLLDNLAAIISRHYAPLVEAAEAVMRWGDGGLDINRDLRAALDAVRGKAR